MQIRRIVPATTSWEWLENSNDYLLHDDSDYFLVDGGGSPSEHYTEHIGAVLSETVPEGQPINYVFTHAHPDHAWYVDRLFTRNPPQQIFASAEAISFLHNPQSLLRYWAHCLTPLASRLPVSLKLPIWSGLDVPVTAIKDGDRIHPDLRVLALPGHSIDSIGIYDERDGVLIAGDLINPASLNGFPAFVTPDGDLHQYLASLEIVDGLVLNKFLAGHGQPVQGREAIRALIHNVRSMTLRLAGAAHSGSRFDLWSMMVRTRPPTVSLACLPVVALALRRETPLPAVASLEQLNGK